jgi:hypothetical protein
MVLTPALVSAQPTVTPVQNSIVAQPTDTITVDFTSLNLSSGADTIQVYGSRFGQHEGEIEVSGSTLRFVSDCPFRPGETVTVTLSDDAIGSLSDPFVWQFTVRSEFGSGSFSKQTPVQFSGAEGAATEPAKLGSVVIPSEPYAAEFNRPLTTSDPGDLQTDVAFVNQEAGHVRVLFGPDLEKGNSQTIPAPDATTLAGGDINEDGLPDLVTANSLDDALTVFVNEGGSFTESQSISTGSRPTDVTIADLDGDGAQDLAVTPFGTDSVFVHFNRNDGSGTFEPAEVYATGSAPTTLLARDIDRDGDLDLLVGSAGEDRIDWLENEGARQFSLSGSIDLSFTPSALTANDVVPNTGDGWIDLVVTSQNQDQIRLYENDGTSAFSFTERSISSLADPVPGIELADLDAGQSGERDQGVFDLDLITTFGSVGTLRTLLNTNNSPGYSDPESYTASSPIGVVSLDAERDGSQDFLVINSRGTTAQLFRNEGGRPGPVTVSGDPLRFGKICVGDDSTETVDVENITNNDVVVSESSVPTGFEVDTPLPDTLRPNETATLAVTFSPTAIQGYGGDLVLQVNELTQFCGRETPPVNLPIEVEGTGAGIDLSATPETLSFGELIVGNSSTESFDIVNDGNNIADVQNITGLAGGPFELQNPPSEISPGEQSVSVTFSPSDPNESYRDTVRVTAADRCGQQTVAVVLTGSSRPQRPDLAAEDVRVEGERPDPIRVNDTLDVFCRYSNQGGRDIEEPFDIVLRRDGNQLGRTDGELLEVNASARTPSVSLSFSDLGSTEIVCEVDVANTLTEQDEGNNTATLPLTVERPDQLPVSPNPFTPVPTTEGLNDVVEFRVAEFGLSQPTVRIYTFQGRLVRTINQVEGGVLEWDGTNDNGERMPPGAYLYVVQDGGQDVASGDVVLAR